MIDGLRRSALACALEGGLLVAGLAEAPAAAQTSCDPSYPDFCIPSVWEVGDLDCIDIGVGWFTVLPPDPHYFDADFNGYGCESY